MKKVLCLIAALTIALTSLSCTKIKARVEIKAANEAYQKEDWGTALSHYQRARQIDPSFADLDRLVGYSEIGLYVPDDKNAEERGARRCRHRGAQQVPQEPARRPNRPRRVDQHVPQREPDLAGHRLLPSTTSSPTRRISRRSSRSRRSTPSRVTSTNR